MSLFLIKVLPVRSTRHRIIVPKQSSLPQLWKQQFNHINESLRLQGISDVEPIDISFIDPALELISDLRWGPDYCGPETSDREMLSYGGFGPFWDAGERLGPGLYCRSISYISTQREKGV